MRSDTHASSMIAMRFSDMQYGLLVKDLALAVLDAVAQLINKPQWFAAQKTIPPQLTLAQ